MGTGPEGKPNHVIRGVGFEPLNISPTSGEEGELETEFNHVINDTINYG